MTAIISCIICSKKWAHLGKAEKDGLPRQPKVTIRTRNKSCVLRSRWVASCYSFKSSWLFCFFFFIWIASPTFSWCVVHINIWNRQKTLPSQNCSQRYFPTTKLVVRISFWLITPSILLWNRSYNLTQVGSGLTCLVFWMLIWSLNIF